VPDELTRALLLEEVADDSAIAAALFASVTAGVPMVQALTDAGAVSPDVLARYLARTDAPFLRQVAPLAELVERLPQGLCARLLAIPVRRDAITGTIDVVVADASDPHPAREVGYHLGAPVRAVRAPLAAIEDALRRMRPRGASAAPGARTAEGDAADDERLYDSRPRAPVAAAGTRATLPPPDPRDTPRGGHVVLDSLTAALRPSRLPTQTAHAHVVPAPPSLPRASRETPPWGTPIHAAAPAVGSDPPRSGLGSEIPIPLTRRTFASGRGGTQRPPPLIDPKDSLGEGIPVDPGQYREIVEVRTEHGSAADGRWAGSHALPMPSFIPGPPPIIGQGAFAGYAPQLPFADVGGIIAALKVAGSRDEVLELVLTGARMVAVRVALFVVKRGGYLGWACTPEFGDRGAVQSVLVPLDLPSAFDEAVREGLYLGPLRHDAVHSPLLHVMRHASRDVAIVPIRVSGKTAVVIVADELGDTMLATRRLEELARAAGDAFARIVRMRR